MKILVKLPNWVGDSVMATPALDWLRATLPEAEIHGLARRAVAGVLTGHPALDRLVQADERALPTDVAALFAGTRYDAVALMTNSFGTAWFALRHLNARARVGFARAGRRLLLTHPVPFHRPDWQTPAPRPVSYRSRVSGTGHPGHMVQYYLRVAVETARALGVDADPPEPTLDTPLTLPVLPEAEAAAEAALRGDNPHGAPLVGINPGAAYGGAKRYPLDRLVEAAEAVAGRVGGRIVSTGSRFESALNDQLSAHARTKILRTGEGLDLPGLTSLMRRLAVFITNDSGAMHIAAATRTPTVAVFGPTDWNVTCPWSRHAVVLRDSPPCAPCLLRECPIDHRCMTAITARHVADEALALLGRNGGA